MEVFEIDLSSPAGAAQPVARGRACLWTPFRISNLDQRTDVTSWRRTTTLAHDTQHPAY